MAERLLRPFVRCAYDVTYCHRLLLRARLLSFTTRSQHKKITEFTGKALSFRLPQGNTGSGASLFNRKVSTEQKVFKTIQKTGGRSDIQFNVG